MTKGRMAMKNINTNYNVKQNCSEWVQQNLQKGQKVIYEGEAAYVISLKPVLVIKAGDRVVCGAIREYLRWSGNTYH